MQNVKYILFIGIMILVLIISPQNVLAQEDTEQDGITVSTDKRTYESGEEILISGFVETKFAEMYVMMQIISDKGNLVRVDQITVNQDNSFEINLITGGTFNEIGTYTIRVFYGVDSKFKAATTFDIISSTQMIKSAETTKEVISTPIIPESIESKIIEGVSDFDVGYKISGGEIISIIPNLEDVSLIININTENDGELEITLSKEVIDTDSEFIVLVDGKKTNFYQIEEINSRILTTSFPAGAKQIEIFGTFVIPEFGTIAAMILAVAIVSIIAVSAKTRLSLVPRH